MTESVHLHELTEIFPPMPEEEFQALKADIQTHGQLEPIWLSKDRKVIDGRHRLRACRELGIEPDFEESEAEEHELPGLVISLNLKRRHMSESQRAMVAARIKPIYEEAAKQRMLATQNNASADIAKDEVADEEHRQSRDDAAKAVNVSARSVSYAEKVISDGIRELNDAVMAGKLAVSDAARAAKLPAEMQQKVVERVQGGTAKNAKDAIKQMRTAEQIERIQNMDPVEGEYNVVVVDPAWQYEKTREGDPTQRGTTPYPTMTELEIAAIKIPAAEDCILWLWTTNAHLVTGEASRVLYAWGFEPKTMLTWVKPKWGTGDWLRGKTEHCILAVKGKPKMIDPLPSTELQAPVGEHSRKPDAFYEMVEDCCPGTKCELFSRVDRAGWVTHGAEQGTVE